MHARYVDEMVGVDPLHIRRIQRHDGPLARWGDAARFAPPEHVHVFGTFLRQYAVVDAMELMFRDGPTVLAGLNVAWTEADARPTASTITLAKQLQRYIEFCLIDHLSAKRKSWAEAARSFGLTAREREVAQLVCQGHTNQAIATCLGIGPSTVKTHLLRIFEKCQVDSRAGLVGRLSEPGS
jgi:DNA-binding CsgD family transcriptional regulator